MYYTLAKVYKLKEISALLYTRIRIPCYHSIMEANVYGLNTCLARNYRIDFTLLVKNFILRDIITMTIMNYSTEKHLSFERLHDIVHGICSNIERTVPSEAITVIGGKTSRHLYVDIMQGKTMMFTSGHETITMEVMGVDVVHRGVDRVIGGHVTLEEYQWLYDEIELRFKVMQLGDVTDNVYKVKDITSIEYHDVNTCTHLYPLYAAVSVAVSNQLNYIYCFHK